MRMFRAGRSGFGWGARLAIVAAAGALAFVAGASRGAEAAASPLKLRFGGDAAATRVVLELSEAVSGEVVSNGAADGHVVLDFARLSVGDELDGRGKGLVKAWSIDKAHGHARLSLDLNGRGHVRRRFLLPPGEGVTVYRYVLDIDADGPATKPAPKAQVAQGPAAQGPPVQGPPAQPQQVAQVQAPRATPKPPIQAAADPDPSGFDVLAGLQNASLPDIAGFTGDRKDGKTGPAKSESRAPLARKIIVIDAGHGGHDPGALGGRSQEKDVTLAAARALKARLQRSGRFKVVMTRDSDVYIPLEQRVKIARRAGADLFISLHADSGGDPKVRGATVYTLSSRGVDRTARAVFGGGFMNVQLPGRDLSVKQILLDLTQRHTLNRSGAFAETLLEHISTRTELLRRSHRDAGYMVLLAPDVPAVLLEMGFITNPQDEAALNDKAKRIRLMDAVGDSIEAYFDKPVQVAER
jgi:N-acetylmuramoyl-L-alanine amidase